MGTRAPLPPMMRSFDDDAPEDVPVGILALVGLHMAGREELDEPPLARGAPQPGGSRRFRDGLVCDASCDGGLTSGTGSSGRDRSSEGSSISSSVSGLFPGSVMLV